mgnify:CR=1 FL=1
MKETKLCKYEMIDNWTQRRRVHRLSQQGLHVLLRYVIRSPDTRTVRYWFAYSYLLKYVICFTFLNTTLGSRYEKSQKWLQTRQNSFWQKREHTTKCIQTIIHSHYRRIKTINGGENGQNKTHNYKYESIRTYKNFIRTRLKIQVELQARLLYLMPMSIIQTQVKLTLYIVLG